MLFFCFRVFHFLPSYTEHLPYSSSGLHGYFHFMDSVAPTYMENWPDQCHFSSIIRFVIEDQLKNDVCDMWNAEFHFISLQNLLPW